MKKRQSWGGAALFVLALASPARALNGKCAIDFNGYSTLHDFEGHVRSRPYEVEVTRDADGTERWSAKLSVPAMEMDTQHRRRDKNMRALLRVPDFPLIEGVVHNEDPARYRGQPNPPPLPVNLNLVGRKNTLQTTVRNWQENEQRVRFDVEFAVSLKEFGLKPPSMLGMIRVDDRVDVVCHVLLLKD
jgi:polyisoprenoid-binding protein YceI